MVEDPYSDFKRPVIPEIVSEACDELKESDNEGDWKVLVRGNKELQEKIKEKEKEYEKNNRSLSQVFDSKDEAKGLDKTLEDVVNL